MNLWKQIDEMKSRFEDDINNAKATAKVSGFKGVKCSSNLKWTAEKADRRIGPFNSADELCKAMREASK